MERLALMQIERIAAVFLCLSAELSMRCVCCFAERAVFCVSRQFLPFLVQPETNEMIMAWRSRVIISTIKGFVVS